MHRPGSRGIMGQWVPCPLPWNATKLARLFLFVPWLGTCRRIDGVQPDLQNETGGPGEWVWPSSLPVLAFRDAGCGAV